MFLFLDHKNEGEVRTERSNTCFDRGFLYSEKLYCEVCINKNKDSKFITLKCNHRFCRNCIEGF